VAFSFYGTFSLGQWESFKAFSRIQRLDLEIRKAYLQKQRVMHGIFTTEYDGFVPKSFTANAGSYAAKLLEAYRILGGFPERDMLLRTMDKPVFLTRGTNISTDPNAKVQGGFSDTYSNGRRYRGDQRFDRDLGLRVDRTKSWQLDAIKAKRERLEYKIKRALDYSDQLQAQIDIIDKTLGSGLKGFDDQIVSIELEMNKPETSHTTSDEDDIFGLFIGRPVDYAFEDAVSEGDQEQQRGLV
jgi:hypothetical protein